MTKKELQEIRERVGGSYWMEIDGGYVVDEAGEGEIVIEPGAEDPVKVARLIEALQNDIQRLLDHFNRT